MHQIPQGFALAVARADFRNSPTPARNDIALVYAQDPLTCAALFTQNLFKAAPVLVAQEIYAAHQEGEPVHGALLNSGQANACTGPQGEANCRVALLMAENALAQQGTACKLLPASTGVIGHQMDMTKWEAAMPNLYASLGKCTLEDATRAIMTTDSFPKMASRTLTLDGREVRITGFAKGAGMICPNMATMLSVVMSDIDASPALWREIFSHAVAASYNRASVDGDTSTNDTLYGFASGKSGFALQEGTPEETLYRSALTEVLAELAYLLVKDGEGATKVMHIRVHGAPTNNDAELVARAVGHSQLVKTAMFGKDPNWGRIVAAAGRSGASFNPKDLTLHLAGVELFRNGAPRAFAPGEMDNLLRAPLEEVDIPVDICLGNGPGSAFLMASDLSHDYVSCNSDYRS